MRARNQNLPEPGFALLPMLGRTGWVQEGGALWNKGFFKTVSLRPLSRRDVSAARARAHLGEFRSTTRTV
jgi:hypothetical protein